MKRYCIIIVIILIIFQSISFSQLSDTSHSEIPRSRFNTVTTLAVPSALITYGILNLDDRGMYSSQDVYQGIQKTFPGFHTNADDYFQFLPVLAVYGLNLAGKKGKHNFADRTMIYLISFSMAMSTTNVLKNKTHRIRPDSSNYRSFPSGHTTAAFVSATFLMREYRDVSIWYGIAGYTMATATGILRMLNNKHWMSDVFVGAGLGIFFTELTYYIYSPVKNFVSTRIFQRELQTFAFSPYFTHNNIGIHLHIRF